MSPPDNAENGSNPVDNVAARRPVLSPVGASPDNQGSFPLGTASSETERLLDIDGLLEMARLIEKVGKDGRLNSKDEEQLRPADIKRGSRPKG